MPRKETMKSPTKRDMSDASQKLGGCGSAGVHVMPDKSAAARLHATTHQHTSGSTPITRTLSRRPIMAERSVHVEAKEVQRRIQAWRC